MTDILERELRDLFANGPRIAPPELVDGALSRSSTVAQRRPRFIRLDRRAWPPQVGSIADPTAQRAIRLVVVGLLIVLSATVVLAVGSLLAPKPTLIPAGELSSRILAPTALTLPDGRILVHGQGHATIFDPVSGESSTVDLGPFVGPDVHLLPDGRVIVIGAPDDTGTGPTSIGIFDRVTRSATVIAELPDSRVAEATAVLDDGRVLLVGGLADSSDGFVSTTLASVRIFDPATGAVTDLAPMLDPRVRASVVALDHGRALIVGAGDSTGSGSAVGVELYDAAGGGRAEAIGTVLRSPYFWPGPSVRLSDGRVLISGSLVVDRVCSEPSKPGPGDFEGHQEMHVFDPKTGRLAQVGNIPHGFGQMIPTGDGRVVLLGAYLAFPGGCPSAAPPILQQWVGVYDPDSGTTLAADDATSGTAGTLPFAITHQYAAGALLPDGRIALVADDQGAPSNAVDVLDLGH